MSGGPTTFVVRHVHDLIERQRLDVLPDHALLSQFLACRDEAAFAALVRRHGPMVLGSCRRVLRHAEDAEDACQATFLVLARKGATLRGCGSLPGWLHRVAVRAASRLRRDRARRIAEPLPADVGQAAPADELVWREVRGAFDFEVGRLPERFRLPLVLCYLHGRTRAEAAAELGWTEGAVRGRLERGRKLLQSRFARKGLTLPAALVPVLVEPGIPAAAAESAVPAPAAMRLADAVIQSMAAARAKLAAWATAAALFIGTVTTLTVYGLASAQPTAGDDTPGAPSAPAAPAADAERNLDTFALRVSLVPAGEGKFHPNYTLYHVLLYVPNLRLEPPPNGPSGKPVEAHTRITRDEARKVVAALKVHGFFDDVIAGRPVVPAPDKSRPHAGITVRFQGGEDPTVRERLEHWGAGMLPRLDAIRTCVAGEAAKALDQLLGQLAEERKRWDSTFNADLKKLQGAWAGTEIDKRSGPIPRMMAKCQIDGKSIVLKPTVQPDPLMDLETIRGTFELAVDRAPRRMTIQGTRDTVSKTEPGTWTVLYQVTDTSLTLLVPLAGKEPSTDGKPRQDQGDRQFSFQRAAAPGLVGEWGKPSNNVQARIRATKAKYTAGETPTFDLDVRDITPGIAGKPWVWRAGRVGQLARLEVDGVWHTAPEQVFKKLVIHELKLGETVEGWATVSLTDDYWIPEHPAGASDRPWPLRLTPGKHRIRVGFEFTASDPAKAAAQPVSAPLEIEILSPDETGPPVAAGGWKTAKSWKPHGQVGLREVVFSGDGKTLATVGNAELMLWDVTGPVPKELRTFKLEFGAGFLGFDPKSVPLLIRQVDGLRGPDKALELIIFRPDDVGVDGARIVRIRADRIWNRAVSPDGRTLAVLADGKHPIRMFDLVGGRERTLDPPRGTEGAYAFPRRVAFSSDGKLVVGLGGNDFPVLGKINGSVTVWSADTGRVLWHKEEEGSQRWLDLPAGGGRLLTAEYLTGRVHVWDLTTGAKRHTFAVPDSRAAALSPDGRLVAVADQPGGDTGQPLLTLIDVAGKGRVVAGPTGSGAEWVLFQPNGRALVTADQTGELKWWVPDRK